MNCAKTNRSALVFHSSLAALSPASDQNPHSERSNISSSFSTTKSGDLPDFLLVEILCRLPCKKSVSHCKLVSKHWCTLLSDLYFVRRFLCLQSKTPIKHTVINRQGKELLTSSKPLTRLFERLMTSHSLEEEPYVVGTYNDLVLCSATQCYQRDYYICNPYTTQWVPLPPTPHVYEHVPVGFICDFPYYSYNHKTDDTKEHNDIVQFNAEYKCKVVRILPFQDKGGKRSFEFKVEIFSFETGDWRESTVSSPQGFHFKNIYAKNSFTYNGMLCWPGYGTGGGNIIIGLDPFMIKDSIRASSSTNRDDISDYHECFFFRSIVEHEIWHTMQFIGVSQGCPRMCFLSDHSLYLWEMKETRNQMVGCDGAGELSLIHPSIHSLDPKMFRDVSINHTALLHFDPNIKDILYLRVNHKLTKCNINTGEWSRTGSNNYNFRWDFITSIQLPWPTPVPRIHSGESNE